MSKTKVRVWALVICLPMLSLCLFIVALVGFEHAYIKWEQSHDITFDLNLWNSGSKARMYGDTALRIDAPRIKMCRGFITNQPWRDRTRQELEAWLGKPDNFPFFKGWDFNYWVGLQRGPLKMDSAWLCFQFDDSGKAINAALKQD